MSSQNNPQRDASTSSSRDPSRAITRLALIGARGRMGQRIDALARDHALVRVALRVVSDHDTGALDPSTVRASDAHRALQSLMSASDTPANAADRPIDAIVDFSAKNATSHAIDLAQRSRAALLVGTTGLENHTLESLRELSSHVPVLVCSNTSLGVAALASAAASLARTLGPSYRASIVEQHHTMKADAPSGTALRLARALRDAGCDLRDEQIFSIRAGDIIGEHTIRLTGQGETIELTHRATTRDLFAHGALRLAHWLAHQPAGWYRVEDSIATA
jgi:4-hydroxy-tetrahydrodipicolinate reductase